MLKMAPWGTMLVDEAKGNYEGRFIWSGEMLLRGVRVLGEGWVGC